MTTTQSTLLAALEHLQAQAGPALVLLADGQPAIGAWAALARAVGVSAQSLSRAWRGTEPALGALARVRAWAGIEAPAPTPVRLCSEPGCEVPARTLGRCARHYSRARHLGRERDPGALPPVRAWRRRGEG